MGDPDLMRRACRALRAWPITGSGSCRVDDRDIDIGQGDALPSIETTMRFLALCDRYGSREAAVCRGYSTGASGRGGPPPRCVRRSSTSRRRVRLSRNPELRAGSNAEPPDAERRRGRRPWMCVRIGNRRDGVAGGIQGSRITMSKSGIPDALKDEEKSLRTQLVAIQRAIEANRRVWCSSGDVDPRILPARARCVRRESGTSASAGPRGCTTCAPR